VATRSFTVQSLVRGGNDYTCDQYWNIAPEVIESLIGTSTPTLFGLATDEAKEAQGGNPYSNKYSCDPKPGFWLNADGRVSIWNDSNARVGISYLSDGTFQFFQFPNRNSVGDVFKTQLFLVNEESNEMITFNINLAFVNEIAQKEEVGSENLVIPVTTDEYAITLDLSAAADSLGVTVDDLLDPNNYYLRGLTAEGVYGEGQNAENGLSFNYDGGYDKYGSMYFILEQSGDEVQLIMCSNDEKTFARIEAEDTRYWVIKVQSIPRDERDPHMQAKMLKEIPAFIWFSGTVIVNLGLRIENLGMRRSSNTWPTLKLCSASVITVPAFISEPVPAIVSTQATGRRR
jgi:hypothetical protein